MSATNLCEAWTAFLAGRVAGSFGYPQAFLLGAVLSLLAIPAAYKLRR
jgi:predicted MFS family arabinose efflux permease